MSLKVDTHNLYIKQLWYKNVQSIFLTKYKKNIFLTKVITIILLVNII